jgi:hypothetical protein
MILTDKLYETFTPRERLALFFDAMARKDYAEVDRLTDTCERKSYRMQDAAYLQNLQYVHVSCLHALLMISGAKFRAMAALGVLVHAHNKKALKKLRDKAIDVYIAAIGQILGTWEAWREFCAMAGVDPEAVMRTCWGSVPQWINDPPLDIPDPIEADPEAKAVALDLFMRHWRVIQDQHAA